MGRVGVRVRVYGRVQGVFFRASMKEEADRLGLEGWVRNNPDGTVESLIVGDEAKVKELVEWCRKGPPSAKVSKIEFWPENPILERRGFHVIH
ncbi:MAG: acylphosphatase [Candidatus Caldarchaeum sp.]|nr:acylphosphatase [Candidatus Caldarchaeum sp.]MDW8062833.1 acylphosphatase [Candidatus Caldarchaeum sp.]MDW8063545.1 acylphosphatase [Candidatus Caldarchaeum sp.]MDW8436094.1 acylphosphatase [Candidatus Caldarchaeum sp.]